MVDNKRRIIGIQHKGQPNGWFGCKPVYKGDICEKSPYVAFGYVKESDPCQGVTRSYFWQINLNFKGEINNGYFSHWGC